MKIIQVQMTNEKGFICINVTCILLDPEQVTKNFYLIGCLFFSFEREGQSKG